MGDESQAHLQSRTEPADDGFRFVFEYVTDKHVLDVIAAWKVETFALKSMEY